MYDVKIVTSPVRVDCGATCLKMLLDYYGQDIPLDQLIEECGTRLIGCSAKDLKRVGNAHGMDMYVYKMDADEVIRQDRPAIVWWKYKHWVVCCGRDDNGRVIIANPDRGRYPISEDLFKSFYSGVALYNGDPVDAPAPIDPEEAQEEALVELAGMLADQEDHLMEIDAALVELAELVGE